LQHPFSKSNSINTGATASCLFKWRKQEKSEIDKKLEDIKAKYK